MSARAWWLLCVACGGGRTPSGDGGTPDGRQTVVEMPVIVNRNLDVLFVIDDSPGMLDKQANLRANFPRYLSVLSTLPGGLPDLHLGVVSTDMGTKGTASATPGPPIGTAGSGGCVGTGKGGGLQINAAAGMVSDNFISDVGLPDGTRMTNYTGNLSSVFGAMATLGDDGCPFEQPLHAMRAALANHPDNTGFVRPDALLQVVFVTDEDDCSISDPALYNPDPADPVHGPLSSFRCTRFGVRCATGGQTEDAMNTVGDKAACRDREDSALVDPVAGYHDFLVGLKGDARKVVVSALAAPPTPLAVELRTVDNEQQLALARSCMYAGATGAEVGDPAVRLHTFLELFEHQTEATICDRDLSDGLTVVARAAQRAIGSPCLEVTPIDVDDTRAGDQFDCIVEDVVGATETAIMPCDAAQTPACWHVIADPASCPLGDQLKLVVERDVVPPPDTVVRMRCRVI